MARDTVAALRVTPLGAGRQVGRSCILLEIEGRRVLLDCGVSLAHKGAGHIPEFSFLEKEGSGLTLDLVLISHFHLDHIGALPYLTEVLGYSGKIIMTHPTRAIAPFILEDYLKISDRHGREALYSLDQIEACLNRVTCVQLHERHDEGEVSVKAFYAGHVVGAVMFLIECRGYTAFYTGDFTMVPDHHLSSASMPLMLRPDVMITESTYATTIRSSKRLKEQELCRKIQDALEKGGNVLVPTFALGRSQELCLLCEKHWARAKLNYPIFFAGGMQQKALHVFRRFASWSSTSVRKSDDPFHFPHVQPYDSNVLVDSDLPMVLLAGTSMLTGGLSLKVFKQWAPDSKNMVVFPGYCLPGTLGNEVLSGAKKVEIDGDPINVRCQIEYMSHADHTDARGILQLIAQVAPKHVVLVHGAETQVNAFRPIVEQRLRTPCSAPGVLETVELGSGFFQPVISGLQVLRTVQPLHRPSAPGEPIATLALAPEASSFTGFLGKRGRRPWELYELSPTGLAAAGLQAHVLSYRHQDTALRLDTFRVSWGELEPVLRRTGQRYSWTPVALPSSGPLPRNTLTLSFLGVRCVLTEPNAPSSAGQVVKATIEWKRSDISQSCEVARFLDALGAG